MNITNINSNIIDEITPSIDPLLIDGNTNIEGNLDVTGVITADVIDPIHSVDEIEQLNNGFIQINDDTTFLTDVIINGSLDIQTDLQNTTGNLSVISNVEMNNNNIEGVNELSGSGVNPITVSSDLSMDNNDLYINHVYVKGVVGNTGIPNIPYSDTIDMQNNDIINIDDVETESVTANTANLTLNGDQIIMKNKAGTDTFMTASTQITLNKTLNMSGFDIINGNDITFTGIMNANEINCTGLLGCNTIYDPFTTEVSFNDNINMETNNILNSGQIQGQGIILNNDSTFVKNSTSQVHIQKDVGDAVLFLENAGTGGDTYIDMSQQNGEIASQISHRWGPVSCLEQRVGQVADKWGMHQFFISRCNNVVKGARPVFNTDYLMMQMGGLGSLEIDMFYPVDFNNQSLTNIGSLDFQTVPNNDNTETRLLVLDTATNTVEYRDVSSLPFDNPYNYTNGSVTQITNINTAVTLNATHGIITTQTATTAANSQDNFILNNTELQLNSNVQISIINYSNAWGTTGLPVVAVDDIAAGSCQIRLLNCHSTNALSGVIKIAFAIQNF